MPGGAAVGSCLYALTRCKIMNFGTERLPRAVYRLGMGQQPPARPTEAEARVLGDLRPCPAVGP